MKILHMVFNRVGQGTYWRSLNFGRSLVRQGHNVTLVATSKNNHLAMIEREVDGVRLIEAPDLFAGSLRSGWDLWNSLRRVMRLRSESYDLVHAFETRPVSLFPALYEQHRGVPLFIDWADWFGRGGSVEERPNPIVRAVLRPVETYFEENFRTRACGTTVICTTLKEKAVALGVPEPSILLLPNGSNTEHPVMTITEARRAAGLPSDGFLIGYVGTIFRRDAELMAQAFDLVFDRVPTARLVVAGYCPFDIRRITRNSQAVIQTGPLDEASLRQYLAACDIFWLPLCDTNANQGRWPLKLNDYMAAGRPTVATAVGDVASLFEEEAIGFLSPDQPEPFAAQTLGLYTDRDRLVIMGSRARYLAETRFSWDQLTRQLFEHYRSFL